MRESQTYSFWKQVEKSYCRLKYNTRRHFFIIYNDLLWFFSMNAPLMVIYPIPGCRYEGRRYEEGAPVTTPEPCLQCRCVEGSLRCRLRVCPHLPQPAPLGCRTRPPGENVCCPELVCNGSSDEGTYILYITRARCGESMGLGRRSDAVHETWH